MGEGTTQRGLVVLADGVQTAFAAGAVAALARSGCRWSQGLAAGLGSQVALLALLGEAEEAARRWRRQGELGCPLLRSCLAATQERLAHAGAVVVLPDAWRLGGWLDAGALGEHLAPEAADAGGRLARAGSTLGVAVCPISSAATASWAEVHGQPPGRGAAAGSTRAARFAGGWEPLAVTGADDHRLLCGGVGAVPPGPLPGTLSWDVVCGFPVPGSAAAGRRLGDLGRRSSGRSEMLAAVLVGGRWQAGRGARRRSHGGGRCAPPPGAPTPSSR
ncbi:MAG: hypothetical protein AB2L07_02665 [Thermoanaerobaculaceae bacterium]